MAKAAYITVVNVRWMVRIMKFVRGRMKIIRSRRTVVMMIEVIEMRIDLATALVVQIVAL
jgi:hypothetical protein